MNKSQKLLFVIGSIFIGTGVGILTKGYRDRVERFPALESVAMKVTNETGYFFKQDGKAEVKIYVTPEEVDALIGHKIYMDRFQTKLTSMHYYLVLALPIVGFVMIMFSIRKAMIKDRSKTTIA